MIALKEFYECGGRRAIAKYFDITFEEVELLAKENGWGEIDKNKFGKVLHKPLRCHIVRLLYERNLDFGEIGELFGTSRTAIRRVFSKNNWKVRNKSEINIQYNFSPRERSLICHLYENKGKSKAAIAKKFSCSTSPVSKVLEENGIQLRSITEVNRLRCYEISKHKKYDINFLQFRKWAYELSNFMYDSYETFINPNHEPRGIFWHLDHLYSVSDAYRKGDLTFWQLCHPGNLKILPSKTNIHKSTKSISPSFVRKRIKAMENIYHNVYKFSCIDMPDYVLTHFDFATVVENGVLNAKD